MQVTRRSFFTTTAALSAATVLNTVPCEAQQPKPLALAKGTREFIAIGPVSLEQFWGTPKDSEVIGDNLKLNEVLKQFHSVELTVIDRRVWDGERWTFDDIKKDGFPKLAVAGTLALHIEVARENEYWVAVRELDTLGSDTDNVSAPATRRFPIVIRLQFLQKKDSKVEVAQINSAFPDREIAYTVLGQQLTKGKDGKWTPK